MFDLFSDAKCQLFSAIVLPHWNPNSTDSHFDTLASHKCFSFWYKRNDISIRSEITGSPLYSETYRLD